MPAIPPLVLLELRLRALRPIGSLPFYHGPQWSALFRNLLRPHLPAGGSMALAGIWIHPIETGLLSYEEGDPINLGLTFPAEQLPVISETLGSFNGSTLGGGHFQPGRTLALEDVKCRVSGEPLASGNCRPLTTEILEDEVSLLSTLEGFTIHLYCPLRLPRPKGHKAEGHHYCDEDFFIGHSADGDTSPVGHFIRRTRLAEVPPVQDALKIERGALNWVDFSYGTDEVKTIGGVVGKLQVSGRPSRETAELLVLGQYIGVGKNPAFGLGFYLIPELKSAIRVGQFTRGRTLFEKAVSVRSLGEALGRLPHSSPGPDQITVQDAKHAGKGFLEKLSGRLMDGSYRQGGVKTYRLPKADGAFRTIGVQNVTDRLVHKALADRLAPAVDTLLSKSSYAYRRGLNAKGAASALRDALAQGFTSGIKADISSFFDSIDRDTLFSALEGFFPFDPLPEQIKGWFSDAHPSGKGLPQGSPLSPLLSNLYLNRFDRDMEKEGFRLIRYADDFVVLFKEGEAGAGVSEAIKSSLGKLALHLKEDKTTEVRQGVPVDFLGYAVSASGLSEASGDGSGGREKWHPVFRDEWLEGTPVYLTPICRGASSKGPNLVVKGLGEKEETIPWNRMSRLVVVGRSMFTGGVIYRALREGVPVSFIDVMGRAQGMLSPEYHEPPEVTAHQQRYASDEDFRLSFAREIISAHIHNRAVLLRRNSIDPGDLNLRAEEAGRAKSVETLLGIEGAAAKLYFAEFARLVGPLEFKGRVYHPPEGPVNVMLSLGYTLLYNRLAAALKAKGFNPRLGFYHQGRGGHAALASDLLEELRHVAERVVLALIHKGEIGQEDFTESNPGAERICRLKGDGFRKFIHRFESTMSSKFSPEDGGEKTTYNCYLDEMTDRLKRALKLGVGYSALRVR